MKQDYQDGEYLVIQTYPLCKIIRVVYHTYDYNDAEQKCELENLSDYSAFTTRIYKDDKLWIPGNISGTVYKLSEQQFSDIDPNCRKNIWFCSCSYPYISQGQEIMTCLQNDNNRSITNCPNCDEILVDEDEDEI